mmetsp:Transcript_230/g.457  ORF Transcript_230/g.457 Transcript_230/m.457 type:complete len:228 (-) Transcript_230:1466-2149(-)
MSIPTIPGIPPLHWLNNNPSKASINPTQKSITITTTAQTDWFNPPPSTSTSSTSPAALSNAPALVFHPPNPSQSWQLSAKVSIQHQNLFDAGTLFVHNNNNDWCKLCFEYSPENVPVVVSVVTRDISDDCNGTTVIGNTVWLRISKCENMMAFHYSLDDNHDNDNDDNEGSGMYWTLHRAFAMKDMKNMENISVGFLAQAPTGDGCEAIFEEVEFRQVELKSLRDGS